MTSKPALPNPKRGEVWWISFDPSIGGEIKETRPAVIVSNDTANKYLNRVQVVPLTSKTDRIFPGEAYVTVKKDRSKAKADQLTTVAKERLFKKLDSLAAGDMQAVEQAIRTQLRL